MLEILKFVTVYDATRETKVKTELLLGKYGYEILITGKSTGGI